MPRTVEEIFLDPPAPPHQFYYVELGQASQKASALLSRLFFGRKENKKRTVLALLDSNGGPEDWEDRWKERLERWSGPLPIRER